MQFSTAGPVQSNKAINQSGLTGQDSSQFHIPWLESKSKAEYFHRALTLITLWEGQRKGKEWQRRWRRKEEVFWRYWCTACFPWILPLSSPIVWLKNGYGVFIQHLSPKRFTRPFIHWQQRQPWCKTPTCTVINKVGSFYEKGLWALIKTELLLVLTLDFWPPHISA